MILDLSTVYLNADREEIKEVHIEMESFSSKMGVFPIKSEPFRLRLLNADNKQLLIQGQAEVTAFVPCDRCLTEVIVKLSLTIDKSFPLLYSSEAERTSAAEPETGIDGGSLQEPDCLCGRQLDVERLIYSEMLAAWPMKVLCREDCRGICSKCGANLNESSCSCSQTVIDPRMAAFQDVFNKFKEV